MINNKGSILLWTIMLGFLMTSVFFFFGMRQRMNIQVQRDTAEILNEKNYLESIADYADYWIKKYQDQTFTIPQAIKTDEIDGIVTNITDEITGFADTGSENTYSFSGQIFVEWNKCDGISGTKGDLFVNGALHKHITGEECTAGQDYDDVAGPLNVTDPFTVKTLNIPFQYRLTGNDLKDNIWHLEFESELDYGKVLKITREFTVD